MAIGGNRSSKTTEGIFPPVADITALKAVNTSQETTWKDRGSLLVEDQGSWYRLDRQSSAAESLPDIVSPTTGSGRWIKVGGISVKSTSITYAALQALVSATSLTPGAKYLISDYKTTHEIPNTSVIHNGATEAIIVRAKTTSSFEKEATSSVYTNDLLHYDFTDNLAEDGTTPRTGKITFRKDLVKEIECHYDWRAVVFRRWQCAGIHHDLATWDDVDTWEVTIAHGPHTATASNSKYKEFRIDFGDGYHDATYPNLQVTRGQVQTAELIRGDEYPCDDANEVRSFLGSQNTACVYYSPKLGKFVLYDDSDEIDCVLDQYIMLSDSDFTHGYSTRLLVNSGVYNDALTFGSVDPNIERVRFGKPQSGYDYNNIRVNAISTFKDVVIEEGRDFTFTHGYVVESRWGRNCKNNIIMGRFEHANAGDRWWNNLLAAPSNGYTSIHRYDKGQDPIEYLTVWAINGSLYSNSFGPISYCIMRLNGSIENNFIKNIYMSILNVGFDDTGWIKNCIFDKLHSVNFCGMESRIDSVIWGPTTTAGKTIEEFLYYRFYNPRKLKEVTITDSNATSTCNFNDTTDAVLHVTLDAAMTVTWAPSYMYGTIKHQKYTLFIKKDADVAIDLSGTTGLRFQQDDPGPAIDITTEFANVPVGRTAIIEMISLDEEDLLLTNLYW